MFSFDPMKTEHNFRTEDSAIEASIALNLWGSRRNRGAIIAYRDRTTVSLRPEFTGKDTLREFCRIIEGIES